MHACRFTPHPHRRWHFVQLSALHRQKCSRHDDGWCVVDTAEAAIRTGSSTSRSENATTRPSRELQKSIKRASIPLRSRTLHPDNNPASTTTTSKPATSKQPSSTHFPTNLPKAFKLQTHPPNQSTCNSPRSPPSSLSSLPPPQLRPQLPIPPPASRPAPMYVSHTLHGASPQLAAATASPTLFPVPTHQNQNTFR